MTDMTLSNNVLQLKGELTFSNVMSVYKESLSLLAQVQDGIIDFSQVTRSDSAGLAVIFEWLKWSKRTEKKIMLQNVPENVLSIAGASKLIPLLEPYLV